MRLAKTLLVLLLSLGGNNSAVYAQIQPTRQESTDEFEVPAPVWVLGQWWRLSVKNTMEQTPRLFLHRVVGVRPDGYVLQITNETTRTIVATTLVSKKTNNITNAVEGYPVPPMVIETHPDNGRFEFPLKIGSRWEHRYRLSNNGDAGLPTVVRGNVSHAVNQDTAWGRKNLLEINLWWQSDGAVAYQATCLYLSDIGRCLEYREGLQTVRVIESGIEK